MAIPHTYVSLIDVLGYKNKISEDRRNGEERFKEKLELSLSALSRINETEIGFQAISDTIVVTAHQHTSFIDYIKTLTRVWRSFLENGLFVRGGIAFAPHFKSGSVTYSHALPVVYEIEQKQAIYPRIVVDKNLIAMLRQGEKLESAANSIGAERLMCVQNGIYFLNTLGDQPEQCYSLCKAIYESERPSLEGNERELAKHRWLQDFILKMASEPLEPYIRPIELFNPA